MATVSPRCPVFEIGRLGCELSIARLGYTKRKKTQDMKSTLRFLVSSLALALAMPIRAEVVNVAGLGTPYSNRALYSTWNIQRLSDGDTGPVFHLDTAIEAGAAYDLDLGKNYPVQEIRIYPRQDNCCPERLRQLHVSVRNDNNGSPGTEVWGTDLFTDGSNAGSAPGGVVTVTLPSAQTGRWIQILSLENPVPDYALQMTELEVLADVPPAEVNRAQNTLVTTSQPLYVNRNPAALADGNHGTSDPQVLHGPETITAPYFYDINLGITVKLNRIVIWARQDACCPERLNNYRVSVHADNNGQRGAAVWTANLRTDGTNPGSEPGSKEVLLASLDPAGTFQGQWIHIESLDNPVPSYALQMAEVEAFGELMGTATSLLLTGQPSDVAVGVGQTATFRVVANVPGGDISKIGYQWQRNGVDIAGATAPSYTTPLLTTLDSNAKFRAVVSYTGLASQTSVEAILRINLAYQAKAVSNRPLWAPGGWNVQMLTDGNRQGVFHLDTNPETGAAYEVDLGAPVKFGEIDIYPRQDGCCPERLTNLRISIHKDDAGQIGQGVWTADFFTDGTNPGASAGTVVKITASADSSGIFEGQWIRVLSLEDPVQNYALQMNELEVYGEFAINLPILSFVTEPEDYGTAPGRVAKFSVVAKVLNGDPSNITYQWQKNGADIPGATSASYTTAPALDADAGTKYRVKISYPDVPTLTSKEATLGFDYNYAKGQPAFSNRPLWPPGNWNVQMLTDGNRRGVFHLDAAYDPGAAYEVDLGGEVAVDRIDIYPRQDGCCPERFTNLRVSVHKDNNGQIGDSVWQADIFTDGSNPGATEGTIVTLTKDQDAAGTFTGRWVRIQTLDDPVPQYGLQMTELEVYGKFTGPITVPVKIEFTLANGILRLTWISGILESAAQVTGPYAPVQNAVSPLNITPTGSGQFYRVRP